MYFFKGQGTGRKKNKQKLTDKLSQSKDESNEGSAAVQCGENLTFENFENICSVTAFTNPFVASCGFS